MELVKSSTKLEKSDLKVWYNLLLSVEQKIPTNQRTDLKQNKKYLMQQVREFFFIKIIIQMSYE